ncbi:unnamed protein product, partial [Timema podura]|nr:unnamed protein product [Timema podura]
CDNGNIVVIQHILIQEILRKFNTINCKPSEIPLEPKLNLVKDEHNFEDMFSYKELIGGLMYLMLGLRLNLCFSVSYFDNTVLRICAYVDSDFSSYTNDRKSVSVFIVKLNVNIICWSYGAIGNN